MNTDLDANAGILGSQFNWTRGTSPPASPVTGDLWLYTGSGFYWLFVYDSSETTYKWKSIGGPPVMVKVATGDALASATYVDLTNVGPSFTLPRGGDYNISFGANFVTVGTAADIVSVSPSIAGSTPVDADAAQHAFPGAGGASVGSSIANSKPLTSRASGDVIKLMYKRVNNSFTVKERWLTVTPVRVI
jgi:hypothetical protein